MKLSVPHNSATMSWQWHNFRGRVDPLSGAGELKMFCSMKPTRIFAKERIASKIETISFTQSEKASPSSACNPAIYPAMGGRRPHCHSRTANAPRWMVHLYRNPEANSALTPGDGVPKRSRSEGFPSVACFKSCIEK